ncbi:MAG: gliding motility protein GldC [Deltaproteobacteria bacterium]
MPKKEAEIKFTVELDAAGVPENMFWEASDSDFSGRKPCKSIMISIWDGDEKNALSIDLWTKEMEIGEMNSHFYLTIMKMAETYKKATNKPELAQMIASFADAFADKVDELFKN